MRQPVIAGRGKHAGAAPLPSQIATDPRLALHSCAIAGTALCPKRLNTMLEIVKLFISALVGASLAYLVTIRVENQRIKRRRVAVGTVIQAELAHLYRELSDHDIKMEGYVKRVVNTIGVAQKGDLPKLEVGDGFFSVYQSTISEIGLFDAETSYGVVYCYANIRKFIRDQENLISEFDALGNSNMWGIRVKNLHDQEAALFQQIERMMARLAQQSRAIPFTPRPRRQGRNQ
jgi:hypothetical protein